jgi:GT2 family glycosyltransferase
MFTILIPTWNNLAHLRLALESIRAHSAEPHQVVVHVNDGSDGSLAWVREQGIAHTASATNIGICYAMNEAAMLAEHEHLVYLNDDMFCLPGWDNALQRRVASMPGDLYLVSGTMIEPRDSGNPCVVVGDYGRSVEDFRAADLLRDSPKLARADWSGATWPPTLVARRWWHRVGGYSTELSPGMSSDNDFSMKLWRAGCRHFIGAGDSLVYHFQQKSTGKVVKNDGRRQFLDKWGITQSTFDRFYLRRGTPLPPAGRLAEPEDSAALRTALWRGRLRKRFS